MNTKQKNYHYYLFTLFSICFLGNILYLDFQLILKDREPLIPNNYFLREFLQKYFSKKKKTITQITFSMSTQEGNPLNGKKGYNTYLKNFSKYPCYKISKEIAGSFTIQDKLNSSSTREEILEIIKYPPPGSYKILKEKTFFLLENFVNKNSDDPYIISYFYFFKISRKRKFIYDYTSIENNHIVLSRNNFWKSNENFNFFNDCGDALVDSVLEGGLVIIDISVKFETIEKKIYFKKILNSNGNLGDLSLAGENINSILKIIGGKASVYIRANQTGGISYDYSKIEKQICFKEVNFLRENNNKIKYNENCGNFFKTFVTYVRNNFVKQFDEKLDFYNTFNFSLGKLINNKPKVEKK